jgi:hypothetical protein
LFDVADQTPPSATEGRPDADQVSDGGSLFDIAGTSPESESSTTAPEASPEVEEKTPAGGSLFDVEPEDAAPAEPAASVEPEKKPEPKKDIDLDEGGSLFDL